jgi:hypothetical protein
LGLAGAAFMPVEPRHGVLLAAELVDLLMRPQLNGGTLIWNDGSSSKGGFSSFSDLSLLSFLEVEVNESAGEVGRIVDG